jgi:outer membrane lipoprotein carrier protein
MKRLAAALAMVAGVWSARPAGQAPPTAAELVRLLQGHYASVGSFAADFSQSAKSLLSRKPVTERGTVKIKKPGRMRWDYTSPEKHQIVADGVMVYLYAPADHEVTISAMPKNNEASAPLLFLTGEGDLVRDFTPALPADQPAGEWRLLLTPRVHQPDFETLMLIVGRAKLDLHGLATTDAQGGSSEITFSRMQENAAIADKDFFFEIPKGTHVTRR